MMMQPMKIYKLACSFLQQLNLSKQELQNILMDYIPHLYIPLIMDMEEAKGLELYLQQNSSVNINTWHFELCTAMFSSIVLQKHFIKYYTPSPRGQKEGTLNLRENNPFCQKNIPRFIQYSIFFLKSLGKSNKWHINPQVNLVQNM